MRRVTKENLIAQIDRLRKIKDEQGQLSMNGEYTLQAYEMLLATMDSEPVALHMGEAINVFNALKVEQLSKRVNNAGLGPMGASEVQVWTSKAGGRLEFISANGGCTLNIFPQPAQPVRYSEPVATVSWVPVSERLPEKGVDLLVKIKPMTPGLYDHDVAQLSASDEFIRSACGYCSTDDITDDVTHWSYIGTGKTQP